MELTMAIPAPMKTQANKQNQSWVRARHAHQNNCSVYTAAANGELSEPGLFFPPKEPYQIQRSSAMLIQIVKTAPVPLELVVLGAERFGEFRSVFSEVRYLYFTSAFLGNGAVNFLLKVIHTHCSVY